MKYAVVTRGCGHQSCDDGGQGAGVGLFLVIYSQEVPLRGADVVLVQDAGLSQGREVVCCCESFDG